MKWPAVVAMGAVVAGLVATMYVGGVQGDQVLKLWAYFLATIVALLRPGAVRGSPSDRPPRPGDKLWPLGVLGSGELVDVVQTLLLSGPPSG